MKTLLLNVILLILGCSVSKAQFSEETVKPKDSRYFIGGSINFSKSENQNSIFFVNGSNENSESTSFGFYPDIGYQLNEHWILGLELGFTKNVSEITASDNTKQESSSISYRVFTRYTFNPGNEFQVFLSPYVSLSKFNSEITFHAFNSTSDFDRTSNILGVSLGAQYKLMDWLRLTSNVGGLYYTRGTSQSNDEPEIDFHSTSFSFTGTALYFGLEFLF